MFNFDQKCFNFDQKCFNFDQKCLSFDQKYVNYYATLTQLFRVTDQYVIQCMFGKSFHSGLELYDAIETKRFGSLNMEIFWKQ